MHIKPPHKLYLNIQLLKHPPTKIMVICAWVIIWNIKLNKYIYDKSIDYFFCNFDYIYIPKGDGMLDIWDCSSPLRPSVKINAHQAEILSCSWNQFYPFVLATGGAEGLIRIWDIRKLLTPIFQLEVSNRLPILYIDDLFATINVVSS